jgi:predicted Zn finger-like uncharacterized protein
MYSQCPECLTRFRVTAYALRAARGTVRCGRCGSAFDALTSLSDALPTSPDAPAPSVLESLEVLQVLQVREVPAGAAHEPPQPAEYHFTADDLEKVFVDAREWQRQYGPGRELAGNGEAAGDGGEPSELLVDEGQSLEDITLEGERIEIESFPVESDADPETTEPAPYHDPDATGRFPVLETPPGTEFPDEESAEPADLRRDVEAAAAAAPVVVPEGIRAIDPRGDAHDESTDSLPVVRRFGPAWAVGSLVAALVLALQLVHYFRQDLVRQPRFGPVLVEVYARLGLPLAPNWDPRALQLRQSGGDGPVTTAGRMHVQASITNRATFVQPMPLLRLQLEDRYGEPVATRDFEPREYLKHPASASTVLAPGASAEADLEIADPGTDAVGYRLDLCLRESATSLRCAQGPG